MARKATEKNPIRVKNIEMLMEKEGLSKNAFSKIVLGENNLPNFLAKMKSQKITEDFVDRIVSAFPKYRKQWLLGLDEYPTVMDFQKHELEFGESIQSLQLSCLMTLAMMKGFDLIPSPNAQKIFSLFTGQHTDLADFFSIESITYEDTRSALDRFIDISDGEKMVSLSFQEYYHFVNKLLEHLSTEMKFLMIEKKHDEKGI